MEPYIEIFGKNIPVYGIFYFLGIFVAVFSGILLSKGRWPSYEMIYSAVYTAIGGVAGAKLLFIALTLDDMIRLDLSFWTLFRGGFVFYGGLFGGVVGLFLYCKQFSLSFSRLAELYAVCLPLGHALGRVGCFFAGCCYGISYDGPFSVTYHKSLGDTPLETPLFPIQLAEALALVVIFIILAVIYRKSKEDGKGVCIGAYAVLYGMLRFCLEFFRGDGVRGAFLFFSTSQWISLFLLFLGIFFLFFKKKNHVSTNIKKTE